MKQKFFVVKRRSGIHNTWLPIAYYNDSGNFLGLAVFEDFFPAEKYMQKYEDKLTRKYLESGKNRIIANKGRKMSKDPQLTGYQKEQLKRLVLDCIMMCYSIV